MNILLLKDFYTVEEQTTGEHEATFQVAVNPDHPIYEGHFPGQPVMPGVCMLQLVTELTAQALEQPLQLKKASQAKFLQSIVPQLHPKIELYTRYTAVDETTWKVVASIRVGAQVFFKFKGLLST